MRHVITAIFMLLAVLLAGGCGQTGPLYLPEKQAQAAPEQEPTAEAETPQQTP